jgi:hypothetical protein
MASVVQATRPVVAVAAGMDAVDAVVVAVEQIGVAAAGVEVGGTGVVVLGWMGARNLVDDGCLEMAWRSGFVVEDDEDDGTVVGTKG